MLLGAKKDNKLIASWLLICAFMIVLMIFAGGVTRLTESGLSMVEWKPVSGVVPPISKMDWMVAFEKYQKTPEYLKINFDMDLSEFKLIYVVEYLHRVAGRLTGIIFLLPMVIFIFTRKVSKKLGLLLGGIFIFGGLQGGIGWYMVKSGLIDRPEVSHYRLALHLGMAVILYSCVLWLSWSLLAVGKKKADMPFSLKNHTYSTVGLVLFQIISGAFVAGLDAGMIYNTFPLMEGRLIPGEVLHFSPWYINVIENAATVQFIHRVFAIILLLNIIILYYRYRVSELPENIQLASKFLVVTVFLQFILGILTLVMRVPVVLGSLHQLCAVLLLTEILYIAHSFWVNNKTVSLEKYVR